MKVAIIGAIEGTLTRRLEKDYVMFVRTLREFGGKYNNLDVHLLQPTDHDCMPVTLSQLKEVGVNYTKSISTYNQSFRDFNYTNKPIACEWFFENISDDYDMFLWLDGDVLILGQPTIEDIHTDDIVFIHNNERVKMVDGSPCYVDKSAPSWCDDQISYRDMIDRVQYPAEIFNPTNSWYIMTSSKSSFWKEWNKLTQHFVTSINNNSKSDYRFAKTNINFENRVEELTMDLIIRECSLNKRSPINVVTYNTPDAEIIYNEDYNINCSVLHYDDVDYIKLPEIQRYIRKTPDTRQFIKRNIIELYGKDVYNRIFLSSNDKT